MPFQDATCTCTSSLCETITATVGRTLQSQYVPHIMIKAVYNRQFLVDLNALAWLEDYLQTWENTILVV